MLIPCDGASDACSFESHVTGHLLAAVFPLTDAVGRESVGGDDVCAGIDVAAVDVGNDVRTGKIQHFVVARQRDRPLGKASAMVRTTVETQRLNHRSHRSV